jgi:hypothetical protein
MITFKTEPYSREHATSNADQIEKALILRVEPDSTVLQVSRGGVERFTTTATITKLII